LPGAGHRRAAAGRAHHLPRPALPGGAAGARPRPGRRARGGDRGRAARPQPGRRDRRSRRTAASGAGPRRRPARAGPHRGPAERHVRDPHRSQSRPRDGSRDHPADRPAQQERHRDNMTGTPMRTVLTALAAVVVLAACGTTEAPVPETAASAEPSAAPVTVTDSRGKEVTLDRPATRVVSLEWGETEMLVSLGVMPVGAADVKGFATW